MRKISRRDADAELQEVAEPRVALSIVLATLVAFAGGCRSTPPVRDPLAALAEAEGLLAASQPKAAVGLLSVIDETSYHGEDLARYRYTKARALLANGDAWGAFKAIRDFTEDHPFSTYTKQVERLEFEIGRQLVRSDRRFLFFTSDQNDGVSVLQHLVQRYPRSEWVPDALALLGEHAYRAGEFDEAVQHYARLVREYPSSEWLMLAQFRIAIARFKALHGPAYDLVKLKDAMNELKGFLATKPENPAYVAEATAALAVTREWLAEKHVMIADFYDTAGNALGRRIHLQMAADEFPDTEHGRSAQARLTREPATAPLPAADQRGASAAGTGR